MNAISASPLGMKRPKAVERNCGLTVRPYISTMTYSAEAAIGIAAIFHSLIDWGLTPDSMLIAPINFVLCRWRDNINTAVSS